MSNMLENPAAIKTGQGQLFPMVENPAQQGKQVKVSNSTCMVDASVPKTEDLNGDLGRIGSLHTLEGVYSGVSDFEGQGPINFHDFQHVNMNEQKESSEPCTTSENSHLIVDKTEGALQNRNLEGESHLPVAEWPDQLGTVALWVKWRGKWQAGIRCARADWPLSTLKAKPTHDRKKYIVVFFPQTRNHSWVDTLLVRSIYEFPEPIAHRTHHIGVEIVKDLTTPRRFIMQKLAIAMLNISDQLHTEAVIESARKVTAWKEFAMESSRCKDYPELGRMLLKLQSMILQHFIDSGWLQHSFDLWAHRCRNAQSAESVETLKEELVESVLWNDVEALWNAPVQPELGSEWKTWKQEVMKWFSTSHPIAGVGDTEQQNSDDYPTMGPQSSRKRPKLEVRRADVHASQLQALTSHDVHPQANTIEIDSSVFNSQDLGNTKTLEPGRPKEGAFTEGTVPIEYHGSMADRWDEIEVEAENPEFIRMAEVEGTIVDGGSSSKLLDPGNKFRQCLAFIEAKGRQCGRWASDGEVYCCVHLASRSISKATKEEQSPPIDAPMCEGTTTHGMKCKHRSRYGSPFCKKHKLQNGQYLMNIESSTTSGNKQESEHREKIPGSGAAYGKEIILADQNNAVSVMEGGPLTQGGPLTAKNIINVKSEFPQCIGSYHTNSEDPCLERAKLHSLYCEKHKPAFLKRARNGKSRIISKEVFVDLLRNCSSHEQKLHLHQACEILYGYIKKVLSRRNPVPKEAQLQLILFEASKDLYVGECLKKLVYFEKEKLNKLWGFNANEDKPVSPSRAEQIVLKPVVHENTHYTQKSVKCKICTEEFCDGEALGAHWMGAHKKEAQWLFRGYACAICMNSFTNRKVLETHVTERHGVQFLEQCILSQCIPCGSHFENPKLLWLHVFSVHSVDFGQPSIPEHQNVSAGEASPPKTKLGNDDGVVNNTKIQGGPRKFICRFCGLKFDLLPDLGRHHQAAHMNPSSIGQRALKKGIRLEPYKLKSGRLSHPNFKKGLRAASYRIRNRGNLNMKKLIQPSGSVSNGGTTVQAQVNETEGLGRLEEPQCSIVAKILFAGIKKTKPLPHNPEILSVARSTCCRVSLQATLQEKYGVLPERLYLKAAKLCSEFNIQVQWHKEGFICPKGCKPFTNSQFSSPLMPLPSNCVEPTSTLSVSSINSEEWEIDECHYIIDSQHIKAKPMRKVIVLCEDVSFGRESVPVACVVDEDLMGLVNIVEEGSARKNAGCQMPWESFTYVTDRFLDPSLGLDMESSQLGCACPHSTCYPETCDHVYLFDNDYENAEDIYGKTMHGRFPYDEKGRIILEEGYLVYECNSMCSCDKTCQNRVLQNGVQVKLEVFKTKNKGWAVRAAEAISRGTFVCEYIGEVLNDQEANRRGERYDSEGCSYLYDIDTHINDLNGLTEGAVPYVIDATKYGNVSRFINHSCAPNLVNYQVLVESMDCQLAHIGLYASRDIAMGEELAYDYRYKLLPGGGRPCNCGAPNCRGRLY
ncbi:histone-lysine N-methyltransferase SUVR5-like isoform X2 [Telopea speciosissima]|uniref:histone-lysine N-methyltransferase SUVR5-like isoform X2 n=1 Tax=Telopea speciosissima TaxID=54955 RepID=UPI001CC6B984|nr:histone-lysine N-methyltransferase SUVR5-like isoform X2 [Telopea speciosissima]